MGKINTTRVVRGRFQFVQDYHFRAMGRDRDLVAGELRVAFACEPNRRVDRVASHVRESQETGNVSFLFPPQTFKT